ncbi:PLP-dependent aminotransferase family protein [Pseudoduganella plicata]|uniref:GntR family transcriptional regulator n=1 Tax=Pseudoduganella plicata TaxID=321984 RepID=A0A4P7BE54_9BURK|nr:PLP-dependent aminotransferase family protein [Pseudoduganella plicata]QBQ36382.1 PLP-dependent aminotransferase family protein [Pseudoduganella plicata]GGY75672.1 GntR family transcriptional regulator [Pseudoduganella plicata]
MARGKTEFALDLPCPAGLRGGAPAGDSKQDLVYATLRDAILGRLIPAGSRLPSTRMLAQRWGLSRGTVEIVYDRLSSEAYVSRTPGSGTRVSAVVPDRYLMAIAPGVHPLAVPAPRAPAASAPPAGPPDPAVQVGVPFMARLADPALFPLPAWSRQIARALDRAGVELLCCADPAGLPVLREQIADYLRKYRGIGCSADDVIVLTGIRHALDLVARSVLRPGDKVCVEDPGYPAALQIFARAGASVVPVPVGPHGLECALLDGHADTRLVYVTPAHQSPTGVTMSVTRRLELLDWAERHDAWVIEDDYDSEFNYLNAPLAVLKSLDRECRVIYTGSFNKTLFAGLRVGFAVVPPQLKGQLLALWQTTGRSVGVTEQLALASWLADGLFVRHLRSARRAYQERRDAILAALAAGAPGRYTVSGHHAGFHFVLWLPEGSDEAAFCARAAATGLQLQGLRSLCREVVLPPAIVVGYTALTMAQARHSARLLAGLLSASD